MQENNVFTTMNGVRLALVSMFLILSVLFLTMPVSAEVEIGVQAQVAPTFNVVIEPGWVDMGTMTIGLNEAQGTFINSTGNSPFSIKIRDNGVIGGYNGAGLKFLDNTGTPTGMMQTPMQAKLGAHEPVTITTTDTEIYSGTAGSFSGRITYLQTVTINDKPTNGVSKYWTKLVVSGNAI